MQLPVQWVLRALLPGVKWLWNEVDKTFPASAKLKNGGAIPLPPPPPNMSSWRGA
jgi:hypothetical protein